MIRKNTAQKLASNWHGGQWSALYQYASSGVFVRENAALYCKEVQDCMNQQGLASIPFDYPKKDQKELSNLLAYFLELGKIEGISIEVGKHEFYGYPVIICNDTTVKTPMYPY